MALISCPECNKQISDKASKCPNCGFPILNDISQIKNNNEEQSEILHCPNFPENLKIGKQITNWNNDAYFKGFINESENTLSEIPSGKVSVILHTHGICLNGQTKTYSIHNSQIITLKTISQEELVKTDNSVIGRALVGGLILGPIGAILGSVSGFGTNGSFLDKKYFIVNFWDINTKKVQSILISSLDGVKVPLFIARQDKENKLNIAEKREAQPDIPPLWIFICISIILISFILLVYSYLQYMYY